MLSHYYFSLHVLLRVDHIPSKTDRTKFILFTIFLAIVCITTLSIRPYNLLYQLSLSNIIIGVIAPFIAFICGSYQMYHNGWQLKQFSKNSRLYFGVDGTTINLHFSGSEKNLRSAIRSFKILLAYCMKAEKCYIIKLKSPLLTNSKFRCLLIGVTEEINSSFDCREIKVTPEKWKPNTVFVQLSYLLSFLTIKSKKRSLLWTAARSHWPQIDLVISPKIASQ
jgi:hypothetical protein